MAKRVISFFLALVLSLAVSVPSFAFEVATSSDAESSVLSGISTGIDDAILSIRPFSSLASVTNTIDYSGLSLILNYDSTGGGRKATFSYSNSDGHISMSEPSDYDSSSSNNNITFVLGLDSLPSPGTYQFQIDVASATGNVYSSAFLAFYRYPVNTEYEDQRVSVSPLYNAGDIYYSGVVGVGSGRDLSLRLTLLAVDLSFPLSFDVDVSFSAVELDPIISSPGASNVSQDVQQNISDSVGSISSDLGSISSSIDSVEEGIEEISSNTGYMVNGLREMANTLEEIVATISNQLSALWDQLYNNMHLPQLANDDKNTELIVEAIDDIELDISADLEAQTDSINQNNDKNTDTIVNGYDSSSLDASNDALSSAMESQEAQEEQILEQISEPLEDFEFDNPITQYLSAFQMFGDFLQDLFVGSGGFKDVINLSFLMPIALIVIGMYRFKGGG